MYSLQSISLIFIAIASVTAHEFDSIKCYECSDAYHAGTNILPCRGFQPNSTYEINCEMRDGNLCISQWTLKRPIDRRINSDRDDLGWHISQRGCVDASHNNTLFRRKFVSKGCGQWKYIKSGEMENPRTYGAHCAPRDIGFVRLHYLEDWCVCDSDLCNDHDETIDPNDDHIQTTDKEPITETPMTPGKDKGTLKCYECIDGRSCSQPSENYQINCENVNSSFCYSTMEYNGNNWAVKERGCAGLMKKDHKLTIVPHKKQNWDEQLDQLEDQGYQFVSEQVVQGYGDTANCVSDTSLLRPAKKEEICACSGNLCNSWK